jgi:hypothetical protein
MITHLISQDEPHLSGMRHRPACGVDPAVWSDYTEFKNYVTCNKCRGTKLYEQAESGHEPAHAQAIYHLEVVLQRLQSEVDEAYEADMDIHDPSEYRELTEQRDNLVMSIATLKALQSVELMVKK